MKHKSVCLAVGDIAYTALEAQTAGEKLYLVDPQGMDEPMFSHHHITPAIYMHLQIYKGYFNCTTGYKYKLGTIILLFNPNSDLEKSKLIS